MIREREKTERLEEEVVHWADKKEQERREMKAEPPGIDKPPPQCVFRDSVCCRVCVCGGGGFGGALMCLYQIYTCAKTDA